MKLRPNYEEPADSQLDALQVGPDEVLWNAVVAVIEMICADTEDGTGRAHRIHGTSGEAVWAVRVPHADPDNYYVLWNEAAAPDGPPEAVFYYVGPLPQELAP